MKKDIYARILRSERSVKARLVLCKALQYTTRQKSGPISRVCVIYMFSTTDIVWMYIYL